MCTVLHSSNFPHSAWTSSVLPEPLCKVETGVTQPCLQENLVLAASAALHQHAHRTATEYATREATMVFCGDFYTPWSFRLLLQETVELEPGALISAFCPVSIQRSFKGLKPSSNTYGRSWQISLIFCKVGHRSFELHSLLGVGSFGSASPTSFRSQESQVEVDHMNHMEVS